MWQVVFDKKPPKRDKNVTLNHELGCDHVARNNCQVSSDRCKICCQFFGEEKPSFP